MERCQAAERIGIYVSLADEVDTHRLIERLLAEGKSIYVPRCHQRTLTFHRIQSLNELRPSRFRLLEPDNDPSPLAEMELIFVPLVGFDRKRNRIGYGRGYYDSVLKKISVPKIGLAYRFQQVEELPREPHDVPLDEILTD